MTLTHWCYKCNMPLSKKDMEKNHKEHNDEYNKRVEKTIKLHNERERSFH